MTSSEASLSFVVCGDDMATGPQGSSPFILDPTRQMRDRASKILHIRKHKRFNRAIYNLDFFGKCSPALHLMSKMSNVVKSLSDLSTREDLIALASLSPRLLVARREQ